MNLAELARAGFHVPPGFIISTEAYRSFVSANQLHERILVRARGCTPDDVRALDAACAEIHSLFEQGSVPGDVADVISPAYHQLGPNSLPVAVRSSVTAEDLPGLSLACQQDTYLYLIGAEAALEAVKRC
jgi:phosphoenolpyruvate synthase/pyruvate phosphate dikinase